MTVTVKDKAHLLIPASVQRQAGFNSGDEVEVRVSRGMITIATKQVEGTPLLDALAATQRDARQNGSARLTMRQINSEVAAHRRDKPATPKQPR